MRVWTFSDYHPLCRAQNQVQVIDIGGFAHLVCMAHGQLVNLQAVSQRQDYAATESGPTRFIPAEVTAPDAS